MELIALIVVAIVIITAFIVFKRISGKKQEEEMPAGIQIFNESGSLIFDLANRTTYVLGTGHTGTANGSLSDSRIVAGSTWIVVTSANSNALIPVFTVENGSISWSFYIATTLATAQDITFMYGVF